MQLLIVPIFPALIAEKMISHKLLTIFSDCVEILTNPGGIEKENLVEKLAYILALSSPFVSLFKILWLSVKCIECNPIKDEPPIPIGKFELPCTVNP